MTSARGKLGVLNRVFALVVGGIFLILGFIFSLVLVTVLVFVALTVGGYLLWKTRKIRRTMREQASSGQVVEGEVVVVEEYRGVERRMISYEPPRTGKDS